LVIAFLACYASYGCLSSCSWLNKQSLLDSGIGSATLTS